jgi:hypothetical protein
LVGTSSGVISVLRIEVSTASTRSPNQVRGDHPADQVLHEGLGDAGVDVVVAHLVADAVGAPAQRQLGQVAGPQHDAAALVGGRNRKSVRRPAWTFSKVTS